jgi:hypothetical protein
LRQAAAAERYALAQANQRSGVQYTFDARHRVAAKPDRAVIELDRDQAVAAEAPALTGNIRARIQDPIPTYERGDASIAASAHRILGDPVARRERAHLEVGISTLGVQAESISSGDADQAQRRELTHLWNKCSDGIAAHELDSEPDGPDVDDRSALDIGRGDA